MSKSRHVVSWFEIPVSDITRASAFYQTVFGVVMESMEFGPVKMAIFPARPGPDGAESGQQGEDVVHGALVQGEGYQPGAGGPLLYMNGGDDLADPLSRVEAAGGQVLQPKASIGEHGFWAKFRDTEGNELALHSMK